MRLHQDGHDFLCTYLIYGTKVSVYLNNRCSWSAGQTKIEINLSPIKSTADPSHSKITQNVYVSLGPSRAFMSSIDHNDTCPWNFL